VSTRGYVRRIESSAGSRRDGLPHGSALALPAKPPAPVPGPSSPSHAPRHGAGGDSTTFFPTRRGAGSRPAAFRARCSRHQQAMVMAALAGLVKAGALRRVLVEVDRVLGWDEQPPVPSLLRCLDPATGGAGSRTQAPLSAPSRGGGRARSRRRVSSAGAAADLRRTQLELPPGDSRPRVGRPFRRHRPLRRSLRVRPWAVEGVGLWRRPPDAIIEALVADWRLHVGDGTPGTTRPCWS
jgi:hypothetical protein